MYGKTKFLVLGFALFLFTGCSSLPWPFVKKGSIALGPNKVTAVEHAEKPATLETKDVGESLPVPKGSVIRKTETEAIPPDIPAKVVTEVIVAEDTVWTKKANTVSASTGTVDTSVAKAQIDAEEKRPLLYAAIASALGAVFFFWRAYPSPALLCSVGAAGFFAAWKMADLPTWFWGLAITAVGIGAALFLGHERGESYKKDS